MDDFKLYIGGEFVAGARSIDVINPATGQAFARCPVADEAQLDEAVAAARSAFPAWSALSQDERAAMLMQIADTMQEQAGEFSRLLTTEQGKPLEQAGMEIMGAAFTLKAFAAMRMEPRILKDDGKARITEIRRPLGVVAAICPWNFPVMMLANKIGPALVSGNTVVLKPAPTTPLTALKFAQICADVLPAGVVNVICDDNDLGAALTAHPGVDKIAFTGSTATGRKVMEAAAASIKRVTLELGGNDAAIVLDDADPVATARKVFQGAMANAGQVCIAIKRAYVADAIYDAFCDELARLANAAVVDDGTKQGAQMGPVQNKAQFEKLKRLLDESRDEGTVIAGGAAIERDGYFVQPTVIRDVGDDARIVQEEQFGPVLPVLRYADIEEVLARSNDTRFGLGGSVWGGDVERAASIAERVESGTVWVNQHLALNPKVPFRGAKESGLGTELGEEGLHEYTQAKIINVAL
ncbi:aldehyde dehydrogenase family protein [Croceicoccus sp. YJ47]|uniref:aldehyde dehydrogenase family protein n=1 Tax=Croceicoccus sp. YJ47 TaxID=2798724 RepID=UPI001923A152|nr:aldehyde dehydrogenase family protein [Croceicoccus sp. YJ47]QQN75372.1 aldehyde dehydrogenase family protein [Croceicoccus sp. YJ47]